MQRRKFLKVSSTAALLPAISLTASATEEKLPAILAQRRQNRGFEGMAFQDGKLYLFVQSPLRNPSTSSNGTLIAWKYTRVVEFNPAT